MLKIFTLEYWINLNHPEVWASLIGSLTASLCAMLAVAVAAILAYFFTRRQNRIQHDTAIKMDRLHREIDTLERLWALLASLSIAESKQAIFCWREDRHKKKTYFFHLGRLRQFILHDLSHTFYQGSAGLYMPTSIRDLFFEYKSIVMGLYMSYENNIAGEKETWIIVKNTNMIKRLNGIYKELNTVLRSELDRRYNSLIKGEKYEIKNLSRK